MAAPSWYLPGSPADQLYQAQVAADPQHTPTPLGLGGAAGNPMGGMGATAGTLANPRAGLGSEAAGYIPGVPDPTATAGNALAGNLANLTRLRQLFNRTSSAVGVTPEFTAGETGLIRELQNAPRFLGAYPDLARNVAETGTGRGISGSPAQETLGYRLTDEEQLRRRGLASQMLGQRAARANQILPLQNFMQTPEGRQVIETYNALLKAGVNPEAAFQRAFQLSQQGIRQGINAGYGGGAPRPNIPSPQGTYAGDTRWNALNASRAAAAPGWATLPNYTPTTYGTPAVSAPPPETGEDFLSSLGLGMGQQGVTTSPIGSSFMGDINSEDWYA